MKKFTFISILLIALSTAQAFSKAKPTVVLFNKSTVETISNLQAKKLVYKHIPKQNKYTKFTVEKFFDHVVVTANLKNSRLIKTFRIDVTNHNQFYRLVNNYMPSLMEANAALAYVGENYTSVGVKPKVLIILLNGYKYSDRIKSTDKVYKAAIQRYGKRNVIYLADGGKKDYINTAMPANIQNVIQAATKDNIIKYLTTKSITNIFYDGDANHLGFQVDDGAFFATEIQALLGSDKINFQNTTFIAVACNGFEAPLGKVIVGNRTTGIAMYMAGITVLADEMPDYQAALTFIKHIQKPSNKFSEIILEAKKEAMEKYKIAERNEKNYYSNGIWGYAGTAVEDLYPDITVNNNKMAILSNVIYHDGSSPEFQYDFINHPDIEAYAVIVGEYSGVNDPISASLLRNNVDQSLVTGFTNRSPARFSQKYPNNLFSVYAFNRYTATLASNVIYSNPQKAGKKAYYIYPFVNTSPWWIDYYRHD